MQTIKQIRKAIRSKYAWPGGYPMYLLMSDGECMCMECARKEWASVARATKRYSREDAAFATVGAEINWNDAEMECCHCNQRIESAYGEE